MKRPILALIAVASLTFGIISVVRSQPRREATVPPSPPPVSTYKHTVAAVGLVESSTENISIGTPLSDVVTEVNVAAGQSVQAGECVRRNGRSQPLDGIPIVIIMRGLDQDEMKFRPAVLHRCSPLKACSALRDRRASFEASRGEERFIQ